MEEFDSKKFISSLTKKLNDGNYPTCKFCGGHEFTTTQDMANISVQKEFGAINIGVSIPCGMVICEKCGHIEFFALATHDMLPKTEDKKDGK